MHCIHTQLEFHSAWFSQPTHSSKDLDQFSNKLFTYKEDSDHVTDEQDHVTKELDRVIDEQLSDDVDHMTCR